MGLLKKMLVFAAFCSLSSCGHKPDNARKVEKKVDIRDFVNMFKPVKPPLTFTDSSLAGRSSDSALPASVLRQFVPDSLFRRYWGKAPKTKFYAAGKLAVKKAETYLFLKCQDGAARSLYVLGFDAADHFKALLPLVSREGNSDFHYAVLVDDKYTFSVNRRHKDNRGVGRYKKSVYVFNPEGAFALIMTESNEQKKGPAPIYNPIDTLSHKRKFTGDYIQDKRNFISVRDGRSNSVVRFFVHFEKNKGTCTGELKGEARFVSATVARYTANGDPCSIQFTFSDHNIRMKELEGCGNHRGIRCYFEGVYNRHKEAKAKKTRAKAKSKK